MSITAQAVPIGELHESPWNPRKHFLQQSLEDLAESIRKVGVLSPLLVRPREAGGYEIAAGHRRSRAAKLAALTEIPAIIRPMGDQEFLEVLTIENLQREDVHPLDEAAGYRTLIQQTGWDADTVAAKVGKSKSYVYQRLKLAELIEPAKKAFLDDKITAGHAILIARLQPKDQKAAMEYCQPRWGRDEAPSVRELARWIDQQIHLELSKAPWKWKDDSLLPNVPACAACPKRSGYAPALFPDLGKRDVCLDRGCYKAKQTAWIERAMTTAEAAGEPLVQLDEQSWGERKAGVLKEGSQWQKADAGSCPHVRKGIIVAGDHVGQVKTICTERTCKEHMGAYRSSGNESWRQEAKRAQEKRARETERRRRILVAIRERVLAQAKEDDVSDAVTLTLDDWRLIALEYFCDLWSDLRKPLMKLEGWTEDGKRPSAYGDAEKLAARKLGAMRCAELTRFLVTLALMKMCEVPAYGGGRPVDGLLAAAKRWGVDVAKIDAQLKAEAGERLKKKAKKAAAQIAKKKATKGKGNGKAATAAKTYDEPTCIECGCTEFTPCETEDGQPCAWSDVDAATKAGLCSACEPDKARAKRVLRDWLTGGDGAGAAKKPAKAGARSVHTSARTAA